MKQLVAPLAASLVLLIVGCGGAERAGQTTSQPATNVSGTTGTGSENVPETIAKLEHDWVKAIVAKDASTVERLVADDFAGTTDDMRYGKPEALDDVKSNQHDSIELTGLDVRVYGDTAIATMNQTEKAQHGSGKVDDTYLFTDTWVKRNGQWQAIASHGSRAR